jgi:hypothetical protein
MKHRREPRQANLHSNDGLPTWNIDFTANLACAMCFAAAGSSTVGRICVLPTESFANTVAMINMTEHKWAERPRRQDAFGIIMPNNMKDLKDLAVRHALKLIWYEFEITEEERAFLQPKYNELVRLSDDPSAGFLRYHITEYVEAIGKFSQELTEWLLARVPIVPRCFRVKEFDGQEVVLNHAPSSALGDINFVAERCASQRYWSRCYSVSSWQRMTDFKWPEPGVLVADPRTYHPLNG